MLNAIQALILGAIQGISELFPVSSLGHSVIIPALFHWNIAQNSTTFLAFLVMLHLGTSIALLSFFYKEWIGILKALYKAFQKQKLENTYEEHLGVLLISGTIPILIFAFLFEKKVRSLFSVPTLAATFLVINGFVLLAGETLKRRNVRKELKNLKDFTPVQAFIVGIFQSFALIPGISRSGISMVGGLVQGLNHEDSAKFSFMLATPAILAAALYEFHYVLVSKSTFLISVVAAIVAGIFAYLSTRFLIRYFKSGNLMPFVYYCWIVGLVALFIFKIL